MTLPRVLVIDDQCGRPGPHRDNLLNATGAVEISLTTDDATLEALHSSGKTAGFVFCSGQDQAAHNSYEVVQVAISAGWPASSGWRWALVLHDVRFGSDDIFGLRTVEKLQTTPANADLPVVVLSEFSRVQRSGHANRARALAYVEKKELSKNRLQQLLNEYGLLEDSNPLGRSPEKLLRGRSLPLLKVLRRAREVARLGNGNGMIIGPQGAGKSTLAEYIHAQSGHSGSFIDHYPRRSDSTLQYKRLFGAWEGEFTGQKRDSEAGDAEKAHAGTLLIDEVHFLHPDIQRELYKYARPDNGRRWVERIGTFPTNPEAAVERACRSVIGLFDEETHRIAVNVLLISATTERLDDPDICMRLGFAEPLYTRLAKEYTAKPIEFPSLADRADDIPLLFTELVERFSREKGGRTGKRIDPEVLDVLKRHKWPGNIADLEGVAREAASRAKDFDEVLLHHLTLPSSEEEKDDRREAVTGGFTSHERIREIEPRLQGQAAPMDGTLTLENIEIALSTIPVNHNDPKLKGAGKRLGEAYAQLRKRLAGAALESTKDKNTGALNRAGAVAYLLGEAQVSGTNANRELNEILGRNRTAELSEEDIRGLVKYWETGTR